MQLLIPKASTITELYEYIDKNIFINKESHN